ncbi:MAG: hypothetical protein WC979_02175 [Candidatus Pacearchaeota archaeon]|jgi:hypothetical protein|nr:hypothetical protein [Clostridia bacterium]
MANEKTFLTEYLKFWLEKNNDFSKFRNHATSLFVNSGQISIEALDAFLRDKEIEAAIDAKKQLIQGFKGEIDKLEKEISSLKTRLEPVRVERRVLVDPCGRSSSSSISRC